MNLKCLLKHDQPILQVDVSKRIPRSKVICRRCGKEIRLSK